MAQHLKLRREDEPKIYEVLQEIASKVISIGNAIPEFKRQTFPHKEKEYTIMRLSKDYVVEDTHQAFSIGKFTLEQEIDEVDKWLATDCSLEVHYDLINLRVSLVYWVV